MKMAQCVYCLNELQDEILIQGYKYFDCSKCNSLSLLSDARGVYDKEYYSFSTGKFSFNFVEKTFLSLPQWLTYEIYPIVSGFIQKGFGPWYCDNSIKILDFGAGDGALVKHMNSQYQRSYNFYDPYYLGKNEAHVNAPFEQKEKFDVIVMSHVIEHLDDLNKELRQLHEILSDAGILIIRVPVRTLFWTKWLGNHWRQLDPPYHRTIPSELGIFNVLYRNGFTVKRVICDSNDLSWRSLFNFTVPKFFLYAIRVIQGILNLLRLSDQKTFIVQKK